MQKMYALMATMMLATMSFAAQFNIYVDNQTYNALGSEL